MRALRRHLLVRADISDAFNWFVDQQPEPGWTKLSIAPDCNCARSTLDSPDGTPSQRNQRTDAGHKRLVHNLFVVAIALFFPSFVRLPFRASFHCDIQRLQMVIRQLHGCSSKHIESVTVDERFQEQIIWRGRVEVFSIIGHPKARRCYAWSHWAGKDNSDKRFVAVLEIPPVVSPETAVKVAIAAEVKEKNAKSKS